MVSQDKNIDKFDYSFLIILFIFCDTLLLQELLIAGAGNGSRNEELWELSELKKYLLSPIFGFLLFLSVSFIISKSGIKNKLYSRMTIVYFIILALYLIYVWFLFLLAGEYRNN